MLILSFWDADTKWCWLYRKLDRRKIYKSKGGSQESLRTIRVRSRADPEWRREEGRKDNQVAESQTTEQFYGEFGKTIFGGLHHTSLYWCPFFSVSNSQTPSASWDTFPSELPNQAFVSCVLTSETSPRTGLPLNTPGAFRHWLGGAMGSPAHYRVATVFQRQQLEPSLKLEAWAVCSHGHRCAHTIKWWRQ